MDNKELKAAIRFLTNEIEEEEIGFRLFSEKFRKPTELAFFSPASQAKVLEIFDQFAKDSQNHTQILKETITLIREKLHGKS